MNQEHALASGQHRDGSAFGLEISPEGRVDGRALHGALEVGELFSTWIKERIERYQLIEGQDYVCFGNSQSKGRGGHNRVDYALSLRAATSLAMVQENEVGRRVRAYFMACEEELRRQATRPAVQRVITHDPSFNQRRLEAEMDLVHRRLEELTREVKRRPVNGGALLLESAARARQAEVVAEVKPAAESKPRPVKKKRKKPDTSYLERARPPVVISEWAEPVECLLRSWGSELEEGGSRRFWSEDVRSSLRLEKKASAQAIGKALGALQDGWLKPDLALFSCRAKRGKHWILMRPSAAQWAKLNEKGGAK